MPKEINISCPGCKATFVVPPELAGQTAECTECNKTFVIPSSGEDAGDLQKTETGTIEGIESNDKTPETTNTVKLSRAGIGMMPEIQDDFKLGEPTAPNSEAATRTKPAAKAKPKEEETPKEEITLPKRIDVKLKSNEEVLGLEIRSASSGATVALVTIAAVIAGIAGLLASVNILLAAILVIVIVVVFLIVASSTAKKGKKVLIATNQRDICIVGNEKIELKR